MTITQLKNQMSQKFKNREKQLKKNAKKALKETFGFSSFKAARDYLVSVAKDGHTMIKKDGLELFYVGNAKPEYRFQIGGNYKGMFVTCSF